MRGGGWLLWPLAVVSVGCDYWRHRRGGEGGRRRGGGDGKSCSCCCCGGGNDGGGGTSLEHGAQTSANPYESCRSFELSVPRFRLVHPVLAIFKIGFLQFLHLQMLSHGCTLKEPLSFIPVEISKNDTSYQKRLDDFSARRTVSGLWVLTGASKMYNFNPRMLGYRFISNSAHMDTCRLLVFEHLGSANNFGKQLCDKLQIRHVMLWAQRPCRRNRIFDTFVIDSS